MSEKPSIREIIELIYADYLIDNPYTNIQIKDHDRFLEQVFQRLKFHGYTNEEAESPITTRMIREKCLPEPGKRGIRDPKAWGDILERKRKKQKSRFFNSTMLPKMEGVGNLESSSDSEEESANFPYREMEVPESDMVDVEPEWDMDLIKKYGLEGVFGNE